MVMVNYESDSRKTIITRKKHQLWDRVNSDVKKKLYQK